MQKYDISRKNAIFVIQSQKNRKMLQIGTKAPYFEGVDENGKPVSLKDFAGKKLVLYFYPKDSTPGCTAEACDLRDNYQRFLAMGYEVLGVSRDSAASHQKFIAKYELPFHLIADTDLSILKAYEAWGEKKMYGKVTEGTLRTTYVIDEQGVIIDAIGKVDTKNHTSQLLK
jgi:peroxiredoxin Q/BCP